MRRLRVFGQRLAGSVALLGVSITSGCGSTERIRYKMVVEVDTPNGIRSGTAVREVVHESGESWFPFGESRPGIQLQGEAVIVDISPEKTLFALLKSASGDSDSAARLPDRAMAWGTDGARHIVELWPSSRGAAPAGWIPMFVTFRDMNDSRSVEAVDPADLAGSFGAGVKLKRIVVEQTREPVTWKIKERLGWLGNYPEPSLDPSHGPKDYSLAATLKQGDFRRGD